MSAPDAGFEILEHTADVGVRSWGPTPEEAFRQSALGLLDIVGAWHPGAGQRETIEVEGRDRAAVLVDWLGEVLYLQDSRDVVVSDLGVDVVTEKSAAGWVELAERPLTIEGTAVKAITYHQLDVTRSGDRWEATVYLDI
jgi:SHS2 domain-containing protein